MIAISFVFFTFKLSLIVFNPFQLYSIQQLLSPIDRNHQSNDYLKKKKLYTKSVQCHRLHKSYFRIEMKILQYHNMASNE